MKISDLPTLNASLNAASSVFLLAGYGFIRAGSKNWHRACMGLALLISAAFLTSYSIYHAQAGSMPFPGQGTVRPIYFIVLISHIILAAVVPALALRTIWLAWKERLEDHTRWARWTLPIWLYVSVTGIVVYFMLYRMSW